MFTITIGQASGLIALAVFTVQILLPLSVVVVLVSSLRNEHNAVTWSVVGRLVQSSLWPTILRTDSASRRRVTPRVVLMSWGITGSLLLLAVAGIVTPLGLSDAVQAVGQVTAHFEYVPDLTGFGYGTPPRYNRFSRLCGTTLRQNCPGRDDGYDRIENSTGIYLNAQSDDAILNTTIPINITETFQSVASKEGSTLSGPFDIQYRAWAVQSDKYDKVIDGGLPFAQGDFRNLEMLILNNKVEPVEGLVVDTIQGGIGFRNHSIPIGFEQGAEWEEELTWITPVTSCVDTNLTFLLEVGDSSGNITGMSLVDNGGFVDLPEEYPYGDEIYGSQDLDLYSRAYKGAYYSNAFTMKYFNVSYYTNEARNTSLGKSFPMEKMFPPNLNAIKLGGIEGQHLDLASGINLNTTAFNVSSEASARTSVSREDFRKIELVCNGYGRGDQANITNMAVHCGYVFGAPRRADGTESLVFEAEQNYTQNMFTCASAMQASVKTVKFSINGTGSLANLKVNSVKDKVYKDKASLPLWAVEKTGQNISDLQLIWGMVDDRYENSDDLETIRAENFWLPASDDDYLGYVDSVAASSAPSSALAATFSSLTVGKSDYTGETNIALNRLWKEYSKSASTARKIVNLIATDILAASMVGTKSAILRPNSPAIPKAGDSGTLPPNAVTLVRGYRRQIQYKWLYAIPAGIVLLIASAMVMLALIMWISRRFHFTMLRQLLNQTSTGRTVTNILYPELCDSQAPTKEWVNKAGASNLAFAVVPKQSALGPSPVGSMQSDFYSHTKMDVPLVNVRALSNGSSTLRFGGGGEKRAPLYRVLSQNDRKD